jgi:hypothetical protein
MNHGPEFAKWMELRAKTDRQLTAFLNKTLARGVRLAGEAAASGAPELWARAQQSYAEARRLTPCLRTEATLERRRLEHELSRLRRLLEQSALAGERAGAACS